MEVTIEKTTQVGKEMWLGSEYRQDNTGWKGRCDLEVSIDKITQVRKEMRLGSEYRQDNTGW